MRIESIVLLRLVKELEGELFHDFYSGIERMFKRIASELNGGVPRSSSSSIGCENRPGELGVVPWLKLRACR
ncbi:MAG: hypothetical protein N2442_10520 [Spirochaetes bacterium]|nr:hypothetical protein [Spirochaetota bacterium]